MRRRVVLAGIGALALAIATQQEINARPTHGGAANGGGGGGGSSLLATLVLENTSGGATATESHPPTKGLGFKKGDLPSGAYPICKTAGGATIPATFWCQSKWSDGSTKMLGCLPRFPNAVSGSSTANVEVWSGGTAPSAGSRTLAEVYAASIKVVAVGHATNNDNLSGTWTADLQAANLIETIVFGDGPTAKIWRLTVPFKQAGSAHGQLITSFYLMALTDGSGNLAGFRVLPRVRQPYYNVDSPAKVWRGFSSLTLQYGAGPTTFDPIANSYSAKPFTWSGASNILNSTAHGLDNGCCVRLTTTGTLPPGLSLNTSYWVYTQGNNALQFLDGCMSGGANQGTNIIVVTGAGTGTHTMTPYNYVCHFGKATIATTQGKFVYIQGGGSVATEPTLRWKEDKTYDHTTRLLPPFRTSVNGQVTNNTAFNWAPQGLGGLVDYIGTVGERDDIGLISGFQSKHWFTQAAVDERVVRIIGLAMGHYSCDMRDSSLNPLNMAQGAYSGFTSSLAATVYWSPANDTGAGFTVPSGGSKLTAAIFRGPDLSHQTQHVYYAYKFTGEPQYYDDLLDCGNMFLALADPSSKNFTVGSTYYGVGPAGKDSTRTGAWCYREMVMCATLVAETAPDGRAWATYARDQAAIQSSYLVAYLATLSAWAQANGFWHPQSNVNGRSIWQISYFWWVACFHAAAMEDANALTIAAHLSKWPPFVKALTGNLWCMMTYYEVSSKNNNTYGVPLVDADAYWGPWANVSNLSWSTTGDLFTWNTPNWTPANGDKVMFWANARPGSNFAYNTQFYAVQTSGNTFKLAATPGGAPIVVQATSDLFAFGGQLCYPQFAVTTIPASPPSTGGINGFIYDAGYAANADGCMKYCQALGITTTGLSAASTEMDSRLSGVTWASPKYAMQGSFT